MVSCQSQSSARVHSKGITSVSYSYTTAAGLMYGSVGRLANNGSGAKLSEKKMQLSLRVDRGMGQDRVRCFNGRSR